MKRNWFAICLLLVLVSSELWAEDPLVVFLVRHAEKVDNSRDAELSADGKKRAEELASALRDANLQHVHSSDFIRTRDTAAPIAARFALQVELYDPRDLPPLVEKLRDTEGRHLIVGHSRSTPVVVEMLGGKPGKSIDEASEYDRLYIVTFDPSGKANTVLMRYGKPFEKSEIE